MNASRRARLPRIVVGVIAGLGFLAGVGVGLNHLADVHAYYDAAARLNAGLPLYDQAATTNEAEFYRYPPLLAVVFRPLALLPFPVAAALWEAAVVACLVLAIRHVWRGPATVLAVGLLSAPIAWAVTIGQAQVVVTLLMALASPWAIALAANLKVLPALAALYWVGRRDWRRLGEFAAACAVLAILQLVVEPRGTLAFPTVLTLEHVGQVRNLSPYETSPALWAALVAAGAVGTVLLARTRYGWQAAVALSVLATPRLLSYHAMTLLAGFVRPEAASSPDATVARRIAVAPPEAP